MWAAACMVRNRHRCRATVWSPSGPERTPARTTDHSLSKGRRSSTVHRGMPTSARPSTPDGTNTGCWYTVGSAIGAGLVGEGVAGDDQPGVAALGDRRAAGVVAVEAVELVLVDLRGAAGAV